MRGNGIPTGKEPRKIRPPVYYSGPDFNSFSSPRTQKVELIIKRNVTVVAETRYPATGPRQD